MIFLTISAKIDRSTFATNSTLLICFSERRPSISCIGFTLSLSRKKKYICRHAFFPWPLTLYHKKKFWRAWIIFSRFIHALSRRLFCELVIHVYILRSTIFTRNLLLEIFFSTGTTFQAFMIQTWITDLSLFLKNPLSLVFFA